VATSTFDSELEALRSGDETAFAALVDRYSGQMLRIAMSYVHDRGVAEDVVQETWLTALRGVEKFEGRSSLKTWLFGILMNVARARRRKESRLLPFTSLFRRDGGEAGGPTVDAARFDNRGSWSSPPSSWSEQPEARMLARETIEQVRTAIDRLPPKQRDVILLRDVAGWDAAEVSELLEISPENQRVRLHRARAAVREMLEEYLR
jgi:RNA polymerase sigma-70 factor (ECF subfamily)